jgi:lycopene cyclase domain-containing protein
VTYTAAAAVGAMAAVVLDVALLRTRLVTRRIFWAAYPIVFAFQLVFNGVLTGRGVVRYHDDAIWGPRLVNAPIEDLGFGFALVLTTLATWVWLEGRSARRTGPADDAIPRRPRPRRRR